MKLYAATKALLFALSMLLPLNGAWAGPKYKILHAFGEGKDGSGVWGSLVFDADDNAYGTTINGGTYNFGTVFEMTPHPDGHWTEAILHDFDGGDVGSMPVDTLAIDGAGNLYGMTTTSVSGGGWVFELSPGSDGWTYTDLYNFCPPPGCYDGSEPVAPLSWDVHGNLYGTTLFGGNEPPKCLGSAGCGVAFQMTPNGDGTWTYNVLWRFAATKTDGYYPYAGLTVDASGTAYGATWGGGKYGNGTFFKLTPTKSGLWTETILYQFPSCANGCGPSYTLVPDKAGNLYGSGAGGSTACGYGCGVVFKFTPQQNGTWKYSVVHGFNGTDGAFPYGVVLDEKGNIFGATMQGGKHNMGVAFEITP